MGSKKENYKILSLCCGKIDIEETSCFDEALDIADDIGQHFGYAFILTSSQYDKLKEKINSHEERR